MNELMEYKGGLDELTGEIKGELIKQAESFVRVGYLLRIARETPILMNSGYANMEEYAKAQFGLDKSQVSRYVNINIRFSEGGHSDRLQEQFQGFGYSKLAIMLQLDDEINEELSPAYTKAQIQEIKEQIEEEKAITPIELMMEEKAPSLEALDSKIEKVIYLIAKENKNLFCDIHRCIDSDGDIRKVMAPDEEKLYSVRIPGEGRMMLKCKASEDTVRIINYRTTEKTSNTWEEVQKAWMAAGVDLMREPESQWEFVFGEKEEVAPAQPKAVEESSTTFINEPEQIPGQMELEEPKETAEPTEEVETEVIPESEVEVLPKEETENCEKPENPECEEDSDSEESVEESSTAYKRAELIKEIAARQDKALKAARQAVKFLEMYENIEIGGNTAEACETFLKEARQYVLDVIRLKEERDAL